MTTHEEFPSPTPTADEGALFRDALYASIEPWVLLSAVRDDAGRIVDFVYRDLNRAAAEYRGSRREDVLGQSLARMSPAMVKSDVLGLCARCVDTGEPLVLDDFAYQGGRYEIRAVRLTADDISLMWRDVTERYEMSRRIAESEERYRLLADNSSDVVVHVRDGILVWVSPSVLTVFGAPPSYWIGQPFATIVAPESRPVLEEMLRRIDDGETVMRRLRLIDANGVAHWAEVNAKLFYDSSGRPDGRTASLRVIDNEVIAEEALEDARRHEVFADARYRKLIENSVVATSLTTPDGRFITVNQAICDFFGYDADTLLTKTWQELTPPEYLEQDTAADADIVAGRRDSYRTTKEYIHADGHRMWGDLSLGCMRRPDGTVETMICQIVDITSEMQALDRLVASEERNRLLAQELGSELDSAAHYLRSALPEDLDGPVAAQSRYQPSRILGGDFFDFFWIDDDHLIVYLLDVSGHGVQSALVAVSAYNLLRSSAVPMRSLLRPSQVLGTLNRHFSMEDHDGHYFTIWYGVYQKSSRTMRYASGGHPPPLLATRVAVITLPCESPPIGMFPDPSFPTDIVSIPPGGQLLLYSDGAFELTQPDGCPWSYTQFAAVCARVAETPEWSLDDLVTELLTHSATESFEDDCSLVRLTFD